MAERLILSCRKIIDTVYLRIYDEAYHEVYVVGATASFDLKIDADEKDLVSRASAFMGVPMAAFFRVAAREKALNLLEGEMHVTMTQADFQAFVTAFEANAALQDAMNAAREIKRA